MRLGTGVYKMLQPPCNSISDRIQTKLFFQI